jgi:transcriptional regulator with XRE-family HTH domain
VPQDPIRDFAARLKALRSEKKLTQEQVADRSGLHLTYVAGIETARRNPTLLTILALAAGLGVTPSDLLSGIRSQAK